MLGDTASWAWVTGPDPDHTFNSVSGESIIFINEEAVMGISIEFLIRNTYILVQKNKDYQNICKKILWVGVCNLTF